MVQAYQLCLTLIDLSLSWIIVDKRFNCSQPCKMRFWERWVPYKDMILHVIILAHKLGREGLFIVVVMSPYWRAQASNHMVLAYRLCLSLVALRWLQRSLRRKYISYISHRSLLSQYNETQWEACSSTTRHIFSKCASFPATVHGHRARWWLRFYTILRSQKIIFNNLKF